MISVGEWGVAHARQNHPRNPQLAHVHSMRTLLVVIMAADLHKQFILTEKNPQIRTRKTSKFTFGDFMPQELHKYSNTAFHLWHKWKIEIISLIIFFTEIFKLQCITCYIREKTQQLWHRFTLEVLVCITICGKELPTTYLIEGNFRIEVIFSRFLWLKKKTRIFNPRTVEPQAHAHS